MPLATGHIRLVVSGVDSVESTLTSNSTHTTTTTTLLLISSATTANNSNNNNNSASKSSTRQQRTQQNYHKYRRAFGTRVQFRCNATTTTTTTIATTKQHVPTDVIWYKNGAVLAEDDYGVTHGLLRIELNELRNSDAGNYSCRAFTRSSPPPLVVRFELRVVVDNDIVENADAEDNVEGEQEQEQDEEEDKDRSSNVTVKAGGDVVLTCRTSSSGAQSLKWMKQISRAEYKNYVSQNSAINSASIVVGYPESFHSCRTSTPRYKACTQ